MYAIYLYGKREKLTLSEDSVKVLHFTNTGEEFYQWFCGADVSYKCVLIQIVTGDSGCNNAWVRPMHFSEDGNLTGFKIYRFIGKRNAESTHSPYKYLYRPWARKSAKSYHGQSKERKSYSKNHHYSSNSAIIKWMNYRILEDAVKEGSTRSLLREVIVRKKQRQSEWNEKQKP